MSSVEYYINLITCGFITETSIPSNYLQLLQVIETMQQFNWIIISEPYNGWSMIRKVGLFND